MLPKAGIKSSEFWIALIVILLANIFAAVSPVLAAQFPDNGVVQVALPLASVVLAALVDTLVAVGWIVARTSLKKTIESKSGNGGFSHVFALLFMTIGLFLLLTMFSGCYVPDDWIRASENTYDAVAPEYLKYVEADPNMSKEDKELRKGTIAAWKRDNEAWRKTKE